MVEVVHQQGPVRQLGKRVMQRIELESPLQLLMMSEPFLQPQVGLAQLLEPLVDGLFRVEFIQLLPDSRELKQQGQLVPAAGSTGGAGSRGTACHRFPAVGSC